MSDILSFCVMLVTRGRMDCFVDTLLAMTKKANCGCNEENARNGGEKVIHYGHGTVQERFY